MNGLIGFIVVAATLASLIVPGLASAGPAEDAVAKVTGTKAYGLVSNAVAFAVGNGGYGDCYLETGPKYWTACV